MILEDYAVYLFAALVAWRYFETAVMTIMESIVNGAWLSKRMHVSPYVYPISMWLIATVNFLFAFLAALVILLFIKDEWTIHLIVIPFSIILWALFALGFGLICAVLYTFFRDIKAVIQMGLLFTFFSSPILIKIELFREYSLQSQLLEYHPFSYFVFLFQKPFYYQKFPSTLDWSVTLIISVTTCLLGIWLVYANRKKFYFYL